MNFFITFVGVVLLFGTSSYADNAVALYRLFRASTDNHFYTISYDEAIGASRKYGYVFETTPGYVAKTNTAICAGKVKPVYRLYKSGDKDDHFYTMDDNEANNAAANLGYIREGIAFYCVPPPPPNVLGGAFGCGTNRELRRYSRGTDHFYTSDANEGNAIKANGGRYEGILCYIWSTASTI